MYKESQKKRVRGEKRVLCVFVSVAVFTWMKIVFKSQFTRSLVKSGKEAWRGCRRERRQKKKKKRERERKKRGEKKESKNGKEKKECEE